MNRRSQLSLMTPCLILVAVLTMGGAIPAAAGSLPSTPDGTVRAVSEGLGNHQPQVLWHALPPSYQQDISSITSEFASKMDADLYDKVFAILGKTVSVLEAKKEIILGSSMMQKADADPAQVAGSYDAFVAMLDTIINSELSSLDSLGSINFESFLGGTVAKAMDQAAAISKASSEDPYANEFKAKLASTKVEVVSSEGDTAKIRVMAEGEDPEDMDLVRVEGRWVPKDMADEWDEKMQEARDELANLTPEKMAENKMQAMMFLGMADAFIDQIGAVQTSEELDTAIQGILGGFLGGAAPMDEPESAEESGIEQ